MNEQERGLEATVADLRALGERPVAVAPPPEVAARIEATLATLAGAAPAPNPPLAPPAPPPPTDLAAARQRRDRRRAVLLAAAAALVGVLVLGGVLLTGTGRTDGTATAARVELGRSDALGSTVLASLGRTDLGPRLSDPDTLRGCLRANEVPAGTAVLGSAQVDLDGRAGTLLLLPTGTAGSFTALVVGTGCSAQDADRITRQQIGR